MKIDGKEYIEFYVHEVLHETSPESIEEGAVLVNYEGEEYWIPKSGLEDWPDVGDSGDILITEYWAKKKGMI